MKKPLKIALYALLALVLAALAYVIYVFAAYYRVEDYQTLDVVRTICESPVPMEDAAETDVTYRISSANVGFGAYSNDYSFFMDGGKESRARSADAVRENVCGEAALVNDLTPDFALFQEVDTDGTRSHHVDERAVFALAFVRLMGHVGVVDPGVAALEPARAFGGDGQDRIFACSFHRSIFLFKK